jgi:hypothetical protein
MSDGVHDELSGEVVLYQATDGTVSLDVRLERESLWMSQRQMARLFDKDADTIGLHLGNIYSGGELEESATTEESSVVQTEGRRQVRRQVRMCTELRGKGSWFLPFNKGHNDGPGNPPNPRGLKTDYLWKEVLTPAGLTNILENYAQIVEEKDPKTGKKKRKQVWPRYHQLRLVRQALDDVRACGAGKRYLIQHSAGSGKSNSIAWLSHQLIGLKRDDRDVFDSVIVVTDRRTVEKVAWRENYG